VTSGQASAICRTSSKVTANFLPHPEARPPGRVPKDDRTFSWFETRATARSSPSGLLMHAGEKPRAAKTRQPGPDRLALGGEIPGAYDRVDPADQVVGRQQPDAALVHGHAAVGGVVAVVAHHEQAVLWHCDFRRVVERAMVDRLE